MTKAGLTRQLGMAFGVLMAIMAITGGLAAWRMFVVNRQAEALAAEQLPIVDVAAKIERFVQEAMFSMRGYGLTGDDHYLRQARTALDKVDQYLSDAEKLIEHFPGLGALSEEVRLAYATDARYHAAVEETVGIRGKLDEACVTIEAAAEDFVAACDSYCTAQEEQLSQELTGTLTAEEIKTRARKILLVNKLQSIVASIRIQTWRARADNTPDSLEKTAGLFAQISATVAELKPLTRLNPNQQLLEIVTKSAAGYQQAMAGIRQEMSNLNDVNQRRNDIAMDALAVSRNIAKTNINGAIKTGDATHHDMALTAWAMLGGLAGAIILALGTAIFLTRSISSPLLEGGSVLAAATNEISATVSQIAASANQTAAAVQETTTTVDEVRQTARLASEKAGGVMTLAQTTEDSAQDGRAAIEKAIEGMQEIEQQMRAIADGILRLNEQSQAISDVTTTVSDLAEQSNLLAVNAAIEAAKAGEHGRGFTVVAQEIRHLAEQSKEATVNIRTILGDIQKATTNAVLSTERGSKAVEQGLDLTHQAGQIIESLAASVEEAASAATQISASSQQQLVGMEQVGTAMGSIQQASTQNQESTRQLNAAITNLSDLGVRLRTLIEGKA